MASMHSLVTAERVFWRHMVLMWPKAALYALLKSTQNLSKSKVICTSFLGTFCRFSGAQCLNLITFSALQRLDSICFLHRHSSVTKAYQMAQSCNRSSCCNKGAFAICLQALSRIGPALGQMCMCCVGGGFGQNIEGVRDHNQLAPQQQRAT